MSRGIDCSIIIVSWNTREMTRECLTSVFQNMDTSSCEVIVIDNASSDKSAEMISDSFPDVKIIQNSENTGFSKANNQGINISSGRKILLLNTDTIIKGDVISNSVTWLDAHPDVGAMGCRVLNTDGTVQRTCSMYPSLLNLALLTSGLWKLPWPRFLGRGQMTHWNRDSEREVEVISGCYLLVRRDVIDQIGLLDETFFFFGEETDWCRRMREADWALMFAPVGEIIHHGGGSAKKLNHRRDILLSEAMIHLHKKHGGVIQAAIAYAIVLAFNISRAIFWTLADLIVHSNHTAERAQHFRHVFRGSRQIWSGLK